MKSLRQSIDEEKRLEVLREYGVLDTPPEEAFDELTELAARICEAPVSLITLVDEGRQWFKSELGLNLKETSRTISFCSRAIEQSDMFIVMDASRDPRFAENPLVSGDPHIRFYAGAPLINPDGYALGTLCVIDKKPRKIKPEHRRALAVLSRQVMTLLELGRRNRELALAQRRLAEEKKALKTMKMQLERRIRERTADLMAANERLLREVTQHLHTEETLRASEEQFRQLAENIREVFWMTDPAKNKMLYVSPGYELIWGQTVHSLYERPADWIDAIHPGDRSKVESALAGQATGNYDMEYRIIRPDGQVRWIRDRAFPVRNRHGEVYRVAGVAEDVTDRVMADEVLRRERNLSDRIINSLPGIFYLFDSDGRYLRWNKNFETVSGYSADEIREMHPISFFQGADKALIGERIKKVFEVGEAEVEANFVSKNGSDTPYFFNGRLIDYDGRQALIGMGIDISERRHLEEQLRQVQKLESIGRLAAGVAHDYNNILTVQQGYASLLLGDPGLPSHLSEPVRLIGKSCDRASAMTRQLLLFSRKQRMLKRRIGINEIVETFAKMLERLLGEEVSLEVRCGSGIPDVTGDPGMIEQVIMNLAVNARDAMPDGGRIVVTTSRVELDESGASPNPEARPGTFVCIQVKDTGLGMTPAVAERIFEPFFTTKEFGKGTGLGLATAYGIVKQHEGWIEVDSRPGQGSVFRVYLPGMLDARNAPGATPEPGQSSGGKETILLVEDEAEVRRMVKIMLSSYGYKVLTAGDGVAALDIWRNHTAEVDLLLTDLVMPRGMTGIELAEILRREKPALKVIFTSGYSPEIAKTDFFPEQRSTFLQKPYSAHVLGKVVRELLDR